MTTKPVEDVARDAESIGYVKGLTTAASFLYPFNQDLPGFDRDTCVKLAKLTAETARHAGERLGVAIDYNRPPAPMFHDCCIHGPHGEDAREALGPLFVGDYPPAFLHAVADFLGTHPDADMAELGNRIRQVADR